MQGLPGPVGIGGLNKIVNTPQIPRVYTSPFTAIPCTVYENDIYLNEEGSYYAITVSQFALGNAYIPPILPGEPGSWDIHNIFAGKRGSDGSVTDIFDLSQRPVYFFIQNVGAIPVRVNFSDNHPNSLMYFSFGVPPNQTPSSFLMDPLSLLVFQTVLTTNNIVRIYNSFIDAIDYTQLFRTFDQALSFGYLDVQSTLSSSTVGPGSFLNILPVVGNSVLPLVNIISYFAINNLIITASGIELIVDGTDLPKNSVFLLLILATPFGSCTLTLKELVPINNYQGVSVPTTILPFSVWYIVIKGRTVTAYDKKHNITDFSSIKYTGFGLVPL